MDLGPGTGLSEGALREEELRFEGPRQARERSPKTRVSLKGRRGFQTLEERADVSVCLRVPWLFGSGTLADRAPEAGVLCDMLPSKRPLAGGRNPPRRGRGVHAHVFVYKFQKQHRN